MEERNGNENRWVKDEPCRCRSGSTIKMVRRGKHEYWAVLLSIYNLHKYIFDLSEICTHHDNQNLAKTKKNANSIPSNAHTKNQKL